MRLSNAVFEYIKAAIETASGKNTPLDGAEIHENLYGEVADIKTVRVGDAQSEPDILGDGSIREFNAYLTVQVMVKPETAKREHQIEAAEIAHEMAMEITRLLYNDDTLGSKVCQCAVIKKQDGWGNIKTRRYAASYLLLEINPRSESY